MKTDKWEKMASDLWNYFDSIRGEAAHMKAEHDMCVKRTLRLINKALKTDPVCKNCGKHLKIHGFPDWRYRAKCDKFVLDRGRS